MITTINEFLFTNHYLYDTDARFIQRVKNAEILNSFTNPELAKERFKKAMYYHGLETLDKLATPHSPVGIVFGNIFFRENGKIQKAQIQLPEGRVGNVYVAIIKDNEVITIILLPDNVTNQEIKDKIEAHDNVQIKKLYDISKNELELNNSKRKPIIIDLDIDDKEFSKLFPAPILKNNSYKKGSGGLTDAEVIKIEDEIKSQKTDKIIMSPTIIPQHLLTSEISEKEFVISDGSTILVPYPNGEIKEKTIRTLIIDETGDKRTFSLEFEKTAKVMDLKIGDTFIISPKMKTEHLIKLFDYFNLPHDSELNFMGKITKFNFYSKEKTGTIPKLGVIIKPTKFF
jgi:hypothetical protein